MEIKGRILQNVWPRMVKQIMEKGHCREDERGSKTKEILNLFVTTEDPLMSLRPGAYPLGDEAINVYRKQMTSPDLSGFVYTYGNRLRKYFKAKRFVDYDTHNNPEKMENYVDQVDEVVNRLKNDMSTRRATMVTWDPTVDPYESEVPCMILVDFKILYNNLLTTAVWRSHDIFGAYPANYFALLDLVVNVAYRVGGVGIGEITTQSISAHIYEHNWNEASKMMKGNYYNNF